MAVSPETVLLGSGDLYIGYVSPTATESEITSALKNIGYISGGASLTYKPSFYEVRAANGGVITSNKTDEEVTFKSGILTWNLENIEKLSAAYYSEDNAAGTRRVGIGGVKNIPINYLRFVHTKPDGLKLTLNVFKAQAQSGFELTFDKEKETIIDAEFKALSVAGKNDGNLVEIIEEVGAVPTPKVTSLSPSTITASSQPVLVRVNGTGFTQDSIVFKDNIAGNDVDFKTYYDSPTSLIAEITGLSASSASIGVRTGNVYTSVGDQKTLTVS